MKKQAIEKMTQNAKLGKYTEEQMSAIKLVISFGREAHALESYEKIAKETLDKCTKTGIQLSYLGGFFFSAIIGVSIWGWVFGGILVQNGTINPRTGKEYTVGDILIVYYSFLYGMITCF